MNTSAIYSLVERFHQHQHQYRSSKYKETPLRREFVDPFLEALGWDVSNTEGRHELFKQVIHEDSILINGRVKAPDYTLTLGGRRRLFVEAKKPSISIKNSPHPAFQVRHYAWNAKLPIGILTDFEELALYDCRDKPSEFDTAQHARINYLTYDQYVDHWDYLVGLLSPDAIKQGSLEQFARENKTKHGTAEVDDAFLAEMSTWREQLALNIALRNPGLNTRQLNFAVQSTIDRIVFLRIAEDRGIEPYGRLREATKQSDVYTALSRLFLLADAKYNSGLFHFNPEKGRDGSSLDTFTLGLRIDDRVLQNIIKRLYYPDSPYQFDVIPADILGQVYEQFLGKVIRLTSSGQAVVEDKPEVKKAGGVFYTPTYIVDYIVDQTVGQLLEGRTPGPNGSASKLRILDPAAGSGSFALGAYQCLLNWHLKQYVLSPNKWARGKEPAICQDEDGKWRLTLCERKRILLNNIYGVDIDPQAVEVTKLSLLLKVMEGENEQTLGAQMQLLPDRVLPDLNKNIQCGNSLIGPDFFDGQQLSLGIVDEEEMYRINVFDWENAFPNVMRDGGFDAVIGNPPYVRQEVIVDSKTYLEKHYNIFHGGADLYTFFIEKGISLLRRDGYFAYIVANKWLKADYGKPLRNWLKTKNLIELIDFGDLPVFHKATTYPCILVVQNSDPHPEFNVTHIRDLEFSGLSKRVKECQFSVKVQHLNSSGWSLVTEDKRLLLEKLNKNGVKFDRYLNGEIYRGVLSGRDSVFVIDEEERNRLVGLDPRSVEIIKPYLAGRDVQRYEIKNQKRYLIFTRRGVDIHQYPAVKDYLERFKEEIAPKPKNLKSGKWPGRKSGNYEWYEIQDAMDYYQIFESPKILYLKFQVKPAFAYDEKDFFPNSAIWVIPTSDKFLLGILNSKLGWFLISNYCTQIQNGFQLIYKYMRNIPICQIDAANSKYKEEMILLIDQILDLRKKLSSAKATHEKTIIQRQIETMDRKIDQLVYQLYNLTPEEIKVVEAASKN